MLSLQQNIMTKDRYQIVSNAPHFVTFTTVDWIPALSIHEVANIILDSLRFMQEEERIVLYGYVLMKDHLHLIMTSEKLIDEIRNIKSFTAKKILGFLIENNFDDLVEKFKENKLSHKTDSNHQFWQEGSHPKMILGNEMLRRKLEYIHNNPVRAGYVDDFMEWPFSSARDYFGDGGAIPLNGKNRW